MVTQQWPDSSALDPNLCGECQFGEIGEHWLDCSQHYYNRGFATGKAAGRAEAAADAVCVVPKEGYLIEIRHRMADDHLLAIRKLLLRSNRPHAKNVFAAMVAEMEAAIDAALAAK